MEKVRIDKWLWAVRICKTRVLAADMCKRGAVTLAGERVRASRMIGVGDRVTVRQQGMEWTYEVCVCIDKRVSAVIADTCKKDRTDPAAVERYRIARKAPAPSRAKGMGRPTKKDRRQLDNLFGA